ncbi:alpha/beta hydrolase family protein [Polluticaenibacter yanchengensis]|uniref:Prolyl oligopeptidase family serine peptidase n=1 Tax=Polluticaenibacter yanchengensis TaxID=3014562 RepID=A0ABT4UPD2_9BACT|nr:prolyl oligopeptidase family serine peptidase [Chitinophagaceae bacterium LY-5]
MKKIFYSIASILVSMGAVNAQKKPLDHSVYDQWETVGATKISNDGKWVVYNINTQEGDNILVIQTTDKRYTKTIERGENATITNDNKYVIFNIKPSFQQTRDAKIKKKKPDDMPKDSLGIIELGKDEVFKKPLLKAFSYAKDGGNWMAYGIETKPEVSKPVNKEAAKISDSLSKIIDSLKFEINELNNNQPGKKKRSKDAEDLTAMLDAEDDADAPGAPKKSITLYLRHLDTKQEVKWANVNDYALSKDGNLVLINIGKHPKDSNSYQSVILYDIAKSKTDTIARGGNDYKQLTIDDNNKKVAFFAEKESKPKDLQKFYKLWLYNLGDDSAKVLIDKSFNGLAKNYNVSEHSQINFSKSGNRLYFGVAPIPAAKDTSLVEIDLVKLDVWHYNDDYLQPMQLKRLKQDLNKNYLSVYDFSNNSFKQLESEQLPTVFQTNEGDGDMLMGASDYGKRVESQWTGNTIKDVYAINLAANSSKKIVENLNGVVSPMYSAPSGKFLVWYDYKTRHYFAYDGAVTKNISSKILTALADEQNDTPSDPRPYGIMGWAADDAAVYIYDRYDIWKVDPTAKAAPVNITASFQFRKNKITNNYVRLDSEKKYINNVDTIVIRQFNEVNKEAGYNFAVINNNAVKFINQDWEKRNLRNLQKAKNADAYVLVKETYEESPNLYASTDLNTFNQLSATNPQQANYNWGTAQLYKWKTFTGKPGTGILYLPENFDSTKKYPLIMYFYETHTDDLYSYIAPAPTPSRLNISFFVSRGYAVFSPDIHYTKGNPGKDAYEYVVSAAQDLAKRRFIDGKNMAIQGQSWGGYQVCQLITMTNIFKAAWAGAPVANMTSAYGGIRWATGLNRQFQYEKTQSRIGYNLWERTDLYLQNSPLFHLPKNKTPLVIMHNDNDGAVPWYQGIEMYTAMRRLGQKVWMLNYNGEEHNLIQRKNRKDIQIREQQFFDWLLKGEKPAKWITEGIPAVDKGKTWGFELVDGPAVK